MALFKFSKSETRVKPWPLVNFELSCRFSGSPKIFKAPRFGPSFCKALIASSWAEGSLGLFPSQAKTGELMKKNKMGISFFINNLQKLTTHWNFFEGKNTRNINVNFICCCWWSRKFKPNHFLSCLRNFKARGCNGFFNSYHATSNRRGNPFSFFFFKHVIFFLFLAINVINFINFVRGNFYQIG